MNNSDFKILIVDDEPTNLDLLRQELKNRYQLVFANSGKTALEVAKQTHPDLILLDIMMPDLDGFETCKQLKSDEVLSNIPVIFLTALDDMDSIENGFHLGAVDYIIKPFNIPELKARIKTHLELRQNRQIIARQVTQLQETIDEMTALYETGALVATVVHDAKKFTTAMSMSLEGLILPVMKESLVQSEPWVMDLMNDILEVHSNSVQCTEFLESLLAINRKHEEVEPVDLVKITQQAFSLLSYNLMQEGIDWILEFDKERPAIVQGNGQLIRVFMNLIANALDALKKFETPNPKITCRIADLGDAIKAEVIDNGPGIKPDILANIRKGMIVSTKGKGGNGFGVSGASKIIKTLNGTIDIESEIGEGASFIITLPKTEGLSEGEQETPGEEVEFF